METKLIKALKELIEALEMERSGEIRPRRSVYLMAKINNAKALIKSIESLNTLND